MSQSYVSSGFFFLLTALISAMWIYNNAYNVPQLIMTALYFHLKQIIVPKKEGQILIKKTRELSTQVTTTGSS